MNTTSRNYDVEAGRLLQFLGRIAVHNRSDAQTFSQSSPYGDAERAKAAHDIYTFADLTENVQSMGRSMERGDHAAVEADAELMLNLFSDKIASSEGSAGSDPLKPHPMKLQQGVEVFAAIVEKARYLRTLPTVAA